MSTMTQKQTPVARPGTITMAFWLVIMSAGLAIAGALMSVANVMSAEGTAMLRETISATPEALDGEIGIDALVSIARSTAIAIQVLLVVVSLIVVLWIAITLRAGRGYIRIIASVLVTLQAVSMVAAPTALSIASLIIMGAAVVLTWTNSSTRYIAESTADRRRRRGIGADAVAVQ